MDADSTINWLLAGEPWVRYRTRLDILELRESNPEVQNDYSEIVRLPEIQALIAELLEWPGAILNSHKSSKHPIHKLVFLADIGLSPLEPGIKRTASLILEHRSKEGPFQVKMNIKPAYGGTGEDTMAWALCDAPLLLYSLLKFGYEDKPEIQDAMLYLDHLVKDNGWPCTVSAELGKFRGPGKKNDPCPYATLVMLKALSASKRWRNSESAHIGTETILSLWQANKELHPYLFYMGTDFRKLKAPLIWYDILHVAEVLSHFEWLKEDSRFLDMVKIIQSKLDNENRYTAESVWLPWKKWEFGNKKEPSKWITLLVKRIERRIYG